MMNNKRLRLVWTVILFLSLSAGTHELKAQAIDFGITAGINISSHTKTFRYFGKGTRLNLSPDMATNYQIGFLGRTDITNYLRVQAEPSLVLLGAHYDGTNKMVTENFQLKGRTELLYLQLPLLVQLSTVSSLPKVYGLPFVATTFHLSGGIFGGYLLDSRFTGTNFGTSLPYGHFSYDVGNQYGKFDGGLMLGFGLESGNDSKIGFEVRGMYSFINSGSGDDRYFRPQNLAASFAVYYVL